MPLAVVAIFDIGKTNKKLFLFDESYHIVFEKSETLPEIEDEDGFSCEDIHALSRWVLSSLAAVSKISRFNIKAINFSAHGASFVYLDQNEKIAAPLYNYLKPFPSQLKEKFNRDYNTNQVSWLTASPDLENLNSGLQLYLLKHLKPRIFESIKYALHLPEYFCWLLTHQKVSTMPSIGCHTMLWDYQKKGYHQWVKDEQLVSKFGPIVSCNHTFKIKWNDDMVEVGTGIHDSSSALIPYLKKIKSPFALISTGTWSISLNPFNHSELTQAELTQDCLCYLSYDGKPVKASRLLIGPEHDQQIEQIAKHFRVPIDFFKSMLFEEELTSELTDDFASTSLDRFKSAHHAYHAFMQHLVKKQADSTRLILNHSDVKEIYVDGGFSSNSIYMHLLSREFSSHRIFGTTVAQASSLGAALAIHNAWNQRKEEFQIQMVPF